MSVFDLKEEDIKPSMRVCCRHFPNGDAKKMPDMTLGKSDCLICLLPVNHIVNSRSAYTAVVQSLKYNFLFKKEKDLHLLSNKVRGKSDPN